MRFSFSDLEARLQALVEGSAARLFPFGDIRKDLPARLVEAMQANLRMRSDGTYWAPNLFNLMVHPYRSDLLAENDPLLARLTEALRQSGNGGEISFPTPPVIQVISNPDLGLNEVRVQASFQTDHLKNTSVLEGKHGEAHAAPAPNGFLIVNGVRVFPIEKAVVNIGRSSHNDLVIDDPRVSREHAQIRLIHGRYVIFDLDSTSGTFVNSQRVIQSILSPGDVISLAGLPLIFSQDAPPGASDTQPFPSEGW